jgi:hypothetical protein
VDLLKPAPIIFSSASSLIYAIRATILDVPISIAAMISVELLLDIIFST